MPAWNAGGSRQIKPKARKRKADDEALARKFPPFYHVGTVRQWLSAACLGNHLSLNLRGYVLSLAAGLIEFGNHRCQCFWGHVRHY
jgi:hypothetical protein